MISYCGRVHVMIICLFILLNNQLDAVCTNLGVKKLNYNARNRYEILLEILKENNQENSLLFNVNSKNEFTEFVGVHKLKEALRSAPEVSTHDAQFISLITMKKYALAKNWHAFSKDVSHYDWWMFPTPHGGTFGAKYSVSHFEINELVNDKEYIKDFRAGVKLTMKSWKKSSWDCWFVRIYKMIISSYLFGQDDLVIELGKYANRISSELLLEDMSYSLDSHNVVRDLVNIVHE